MTIESINQELCTGCGICVEICPLDNLRLDTLQNHASPCKNACPANVDIRSCLNLLKQNRVEEAVLLFMRDQPFPAITGRVCPHFCEFDCSRNKIDMPVNINCIERFIGDYALTMASDPFPVQHTQKAAIIGSGPSGLSAAYYLRKEGFRVTVFEALAKPGGMLRTGIPGYRLPKKIIDSQIDFLKNVDVEILTNISVGKDLTLDDLKDQGYQSVFFAFGAQQSKELKVEGSNSDGVILGLDFLRDLNLKKEIPQVGNKVIVIGGGNVAIDVALSVARVGAKEVEIVCLEQQDKMPAFAEGINQAIEEGIKITSGYGPKRINQKKGEVTDIELARCVSVFNKKGEFSPIFDKGDTLSKNTDIIILAIGQSSDLSLLPKEIRKTGSETIEVNPITLQTSVKGVFAGGEVVSGPGSVVEAINTGKKAARAMEGYLKGKDIDSWVEPVIKVVDNPPQNGMKTKDRNTSASLALEKRNQNFDEVNSGLTREAVMKEAQRCMTCGSKAIIPYDDCMTCFQCEIECPSDAVNVHPLKEALPLALQYKDGGEINE